MTRNANDLKKISESYFTHMDQNEYLQDIQARGIPEKNWFGAHVFATYNMDACLTNAPLVGYRNELVHLYAWGIPNDEAIAAIAALSPIVEVGAGTGYWASLLAKRGADVRCLDRNPPNEELVVNHYHPKARQWHPVEKGGPKNLVAHAGSALFLCWPPYAESMARNCLRHYSGTTVAYVGEGPGGCTGDDAFHGELQKKFERVQEIDIPQWYGIHDRLEIWRRK